MSVYPFALDSDDTIIRIDDNISELGTEAVNQLRDAAFKMQAELGLGLSGSVGTLANRLDVSINANGTIKASALTSVGLATLPITNAQVASNAGIAEYKLTLDHTTSDLYSIILANKALLDAVNSFLGTTASDLTAHISGAQLLADGSTSARHVLSHIDLNEVPSDSRDPFYTWTGLTDKTGALRPAVHAAEALLAINDDLTSHENATADAHLASAISVDTSEFVEIPLTADTVQKVIDYLNDAEELNIGQHRATQHAAGIPPIARVQTMYGVDGYTDGYGDNVVPATPCTTHIVHPPSVNPVDSNTVGDDLIKFFPVDPTSTFEFDSQFSQVLIGDIVRVNYGNGIEASFIVESKRYVPGSEWVIRINGYNLFDSDHDGYDGYAIARIDRNITDSNTYGILALASANSTPRTLYPSILSSVIVADPRGACAFGLIFDPNQLDSTHYNLHLELYPSGNPADRVITLPPIDVTGNAGATPGGYTLTKVVQATNNAFRTVGYNYRFIAFEKDGNFGIMLADVINKASFAIISGSNSSGTLEEGSFTNNVVDDITTNFGPDALGFGKIKAGLASPAYQATFADETAAQFPTKVITPRKMRNYIADGRRRDDFAATYLANTLGAWDATIKGVVSTGSSVEVTYKIDLLLDAAELKAGKTLVVQPVVEVTSTSYNSADYGRFIIKSVDFIAACGDTPAETDITVISGVHGTGLSISVTSPVGTAVKLFFSEDSVSFNDSHLIDGGSTAFDYHRYHELLVTKLGKTFSHERARMVVQSESSTLLRSDLWHVIDVGQKLRGYRDSLTTFNKYVRFYVLSYDSTSGEFDGYLGQRVVAAPGILVPGPVTRGKKGVVTRFYDETNVDYLDLMFDDISVGPTGIAVLSDGVSGGGGTPRYVDVELFPSLATDDELFLIGSCEVNWVPPADQDVIQFVRDKRSFGSVDASDFTKEAKDFITAGDRALHQNGLIRGYEFVEVGTDNRQLFFNGGQALVNGNVVSSNNQAVYIPQISRNGSTPATVTWAVCVNENGFLQPIVVTSSEVQWFAEATEYYVDSCTFANLVSNRKNLTPIALVDAAIASITITEDDVFDIRRFITSGEANAPLTVTSDTLVGNFKDFDTVRNWINNFPSGHMKVLVRGDIEVTTEIDLTGFDNPVIFEGDGGTITVTSPNGFIIGNDVTLRNLIFVYNPAGITYTTGDLVCTGNGCIYSGDTLRRVVIENCRFFQTDSSTQRPPFINFEIAKGESINNVRISDNLFSDNLAVDMAAVAMVSTNDGSSSNPAALRDVFVMRNSCDSRQGIYFTVVDGARPGLTCYNAIISDNSCGVIGYLTSSVQSTAFSFPLSLQIKGNRCFYIATVNHQGLTLNSLATAITYGTGDVTIAQNKLRWLHVYAQSSSTNTEPGNLKIINNSFEGYLSTLLTKYQSGSLPVGTDINAAIIVYSNFEAGDTANYSAILISDNVINFGRLSSIAFTYTTAGIIVQNNATITNNIIRGLGVGSDGLLLEPGAGSGGVSYRHLVQGNTFHRNSVVINSYITIDLFSVNDSGMIVENQFDSPTVDNASDTTTIAGIGSAEHYIVERNKNQTVIAAIHPRIGTWSIGNVISGANPTGTSYIKSLSGSNFQINYFYISTGSELAYWSIPLNSFLPTGVSFISCQVGAEISSVTTAQNLNFVISTSTGSSTSSTHVLTASPVTYTFTPSGTFTLLQDSASAPDLLIALQVQSGGTPNVTLTFPRVTYRW